MLENLQIAAQNILSAPAECAIRKITGKIGGQQFLFDAAQKFGDMSRSGVFIHRADALTGVTAPNQAVFADELREQVGRVRGRHRRNH